MFRFEGVNSAQQSVPQLKDDSTLEQYILNVLFITHKWNHKDISRIFRSAPCVITNLYSLKNHWGGQRFSLFLCCYCSSLIVVYITGLMINKLSNNKTQQMIFFFGAVRAWVFVWYLKNYSSNAFNWFFYSEESSAERNSAVVSEQKNSHRTMNGQKMINE